MALVTTSFLLLLVRHLLLLAWHLLLVASCFRQMTSVDASLKTSVTLAQRNGPFQRKPVVTTVFHGRTGSVVGEQSALRMFGHPWLELDVFLRFVHFVFSLIEQVAPEGDRETGCEPFEAFEGTSRKAPVSAQSSRQASRHATCTRYLPDLHSCSFRQRLVCCRRSRHRRHLEMPEMFSYQTIRQQATST